VGLGAMESLVAERDKNGPFKNLEDFVARMDHNSLNKRQLEPLIAAGGLDCLGLSRKALFDSVEDILKSSSALAQQRLSQQRSLFQEMLKPNIKITDKPDWHPLERLQHEFSALGFYLSSHPLNAYGESLKKLGVSTFRSISENPPRLPEATKGAKGKEWQRKRYPSAIMAGVLLTKQERSTKTGSKYAFLQFSDTSGAYEVVVFSETLAQTRDLLVPGKTLLLTVGCQEEDGTLRLMAESVEDLDTALGRASKGLRLEISRDLSPKSLSETLTSHTTSQGGIIQLILKDPQPLTLCLPGYFTLSAEVRAKLAELPGIMEIKEI